MKKLFLSLLCFSILSNISMAENIRVGIRDDVDASYPPYMLIEKDKKYSGVSYDIAEAVIKEAGDVMIPVIMPNIRIIKGITSEEIDLEPFANAIWREQYNDVSIYSVPYCSTQINFIFRKGEEYPIKDITSLKGKTIGTVRGYGYSVWENAFKNNIAVKAEQRNDATIFEMLEKKRVDLIIANTHVGQYFATKKKYDLTIGTPLYSNKIPVNFRYNIKNKELRDKYDKILKNMKEHGEIKKIFSKYGVEYTE